MKNEFNQVMEFLANNWGKGLMISILVYDIGARFIRTEKNYSFFDKIMKIISAILSAWPNRDIKGGKHPLLVVILMVLAGASVAQTNTNTRQVRFYPIVTASDTASVVSNDGRIWYDFTTDRFRGIRNGSAFSFGTGGSGGGGISSIKAGNGITAITSDSVAGGGALQDSYQIDMGVHDVSFTSASNGDFEVQLTSGDITHQTVNGSITQSSTGFYGTVTGNNNSYQIYTSNPGQRIQLFANGATDGAIEMTSDVYSAFMGNDGFTEKFEITGGSITYAGDYSGTYTDRSLTDRGYVLSGKTYASGGKQVMSPSTTTAGLNVGTLAGNPSSLVNGDFWLNSSSNALSMYIGSTNNLLLRTAVLPSSNLVPYSTGTNGAVAFDGDFSFSTINNVLSVGSLTTSTTSTTPAINIGNFAGDPTTISNGSLWYNSSLNALRARINGATVSLGAGITNGAAANELTKSDGTNIVASGLFSTSSGDINLGSASTSGSTRTIAAVGSGTEVNINIASQGSGSIAAMNSVYATTAAGGTILGGFSLHDYMGIQIEEENPNIVNLYAWNNGTGITRNLRLKGGDSDTDPSSNGGDLYLQSGSGSLGSGTDGNIRIDALTGYILLVGIPTVSPCGSAPSGTIWNDGGTLKICP